MESTGENNAKSIATVLIVIIVVISLFSVGLLQLSRNSEPPQNTMTVEILTIDATGDTWIGKIIASEPGRLVSVIIPTETIEFIGNSSLTVITQGTNTLEVNFEGLESGIYPMIFTFLADSSEQAFSVDKMDVVFAN